jgi:hypothetical protein
VRSVTITLRKAEHWAPKIALRKISGLPLNRTSHFFANIEVPRDSLELRGEERIAWYRSSEKVRRGFCATCGSSLFFDPLDRNKHDWIAIAMGALAMQLLHLAFGAMAATVNAAGSNVDWKLSGFTGWLAVLLLCVLARVFEEGTQMREDLQRMI